MRHNQLCYELRAYITNLIRIRRLRIKKNYQFLSMHSKGGNHMISYGTVKLKKLLIDLIERFADEIASNFIFDKVHNMIIIESTDTVMYL